MYLEEFLNFSEKIFHCLSDNNDKCKRNDSSFAKDSTYFYDTCGILINGSWSVRDDRLTMTSK